LGSPKRLLRRPLLILFPEVHTSRGRVRRLEPFKGRVNQKALEQSVRMFLETSLAAAHPELTIHIGKFNFLE
jgi:hypothetical protein